MYHMNIFCLSMRTYLVVFFYKMSAFRGTCFSQLPIVSEAGKLALQFFLTYFLLCIFFYKIFRAAAGSAEVVIMLKVCGRRAGKVLDTFIRVLS